jgi:Tfp pilus assembly protein PilO
MSMQTNPKKHEGQTRLADQLHNSGRLRILVAAGIITLAYVGIYWPLDAKVADTKRRLTLEENRQQLILDIEKLRDEVKNFKDRVPAQTDTNEWVQYVLGGIRKFPVKVAVLDPAERQRIGPYSIIVLQIELEGMFHDLDAFIHWLESNDRLIRLDAVKLTPVRGGPVLQMQLTVLGLMG